MRIIYNCKEYDNFNRKINLNERLEKSRSGTYSDTSENRRKHRVGQKYGEEKKEEPKTEEKKDSGKVTPEQQLEAVNKVIAAVNSGKLKLPPEEINTLVAKKTMAEEAVKAAKAEKKKAKAKEEREYSKMMDKRDKEVNSSEVVVAEAKTALKEAFGKLSYRDEGGDEIVAEAGEGGANEQLGDFGFLIDKKTGKVTLYDAVDGDDIMTGFPTNQVFVRKMKESMGFKVQESTSELKPEPKKEDSGEKDELKTAQEELQRIKDKKDSWVAKYGKNSYDTRLQQAKDEVERLKNKKRSEKEKKSDEKSSKKAEEMKERVKGSEKSEPKKDKASDPIYQIQQKKKEAEKKYDSKREEARKKYDKESDEIRSEIDKLYESDHPDAAKKRKELWNSLKEMTNKYDAETTRLKNEYEAEYQKLDETEDKLYDQRQKQEAAEETESYTRVKFDDIPNSGKVNLKKYLSEKMKRSADEAWGDISKIDTKGLQKMERGLVDDFNRQFDDLPKSRRAEKLYAIIKVKGELSKRGKESQKTEKPKREEPKKETGDEMKGLVSGAVWSSGDDKEGFMNLTVNRDGSVYGINNKWDFEAKDKQEALEKLKKWGYKYVGVD